MNKIQESLVADYEVRGFTKDKEFTGEYVLLVNPHTLDMVRVYVNGQVIATDPVTGIYHDVIGDAKQDRTK